MAASAIGIFQFLGSLPKPLVLGTLLAWCGVVSQESNAAEPLEAPPFLSEHDRLQRLAAARSDVISFAGGLPDPKLFPRRELVRAFVATIERPSCAALQYGWPEGLLGLRRYVAERLVERGARVEPNQVVITSGAQQAIFFSLHAALRPGATLGVEPESYPGALDAARAFGATLTPLEAPAHAYYVMPSLGNPRGQPLSPAARERLLERARRARACIIEDDAYADTVFSGRALRPLLADAKERVFHIGTFSKTLCPGLRVGWVVAPERYLRRMLRAKQDNDLQANGLSQALLEAYLEGGTFEALKARARRRYRRRARLLAEAVRRYLPEFRFGEPSGGFSLWLESELPVSDGALYDAALREGVSFDLGRAFRRAPAPGDPLCLRLSYSCVAEEQIEAGAERLARALGTLTRTSVAPFGGPLATPSKGRPMPAASHRPTPSRPSKAQKKTPGSAPTPAMKHTRPDRPHSTESDVRGPVDRDGNEGHAQATGAKGAPARGRR